MQQEGPAIGKQEFSQKTRSDALWLQPGVTMTPPSAPQCPLRGSGFLGFHKKEGRGSELL